MNAHDEKQETEVSDLIQMLEDVEQRLVEDAVGSAPTGLTEPDEGGSERWEAGQVWAHMAEFVPYWHGQVKFVIASYSGDPVPFGRMKDDPGRLSGIEKGRHEAIRQMSGQVHDSIEEMKRYVSGLTSAQWHAGGLHPVRGVMDVETIIGKFVVSHLEEHADQLDLLAQS